MHEIRDWEIVGMRQIWSRGLWINTAHADRGPPRLFPQDLGSPKTAEVFGIWMETLRFFLPCYSQCQKHPTEGPHWGQ